MKSSETYPKREEFQWRPAPLLCKRFDLPDPFMGKPLSAPRARNKMDSLIFLPDTVRSASGSARQVSDLQEPKTETSTVEPEVEVKVENLERPVDLYKAIFSDDSENDEEQPMTGKRDEGREKKNDAAATTLNRLIAGDFLESLGKELGFEVPSDVTKPMEDGSKSKGKPEASSEKRLVLKEKTSSVTLVSEEEKSRKKREKSPRKRSGGDDLPSSESSGDERMIKRSHKKDRRRNYTTESDSSGDYHKREKQSSSSRRKRRESSREKSSSHKKHSKHHRSKNPSSSRYNSDEERKESRREKRKRRD